MPAAGWMNEGTKLSHDGKEGQAGQSSNQELLKILGGMKGSARLGETRQSKTKIYI